jgi:S-methylmethionine-dependent homocysteine/selenocysteine methylase
MESDQEEQEMSDLLQRLDGGEVVVLDGAMGTELERRGVPMDDAAWSAAALITHPDTVREVHEDYIRAGADVIITNTFATARHVLEPADMGEQFRELNTRAVTLAKQARENAADRPVFIAGSISTFTARYDYSYEPRAEKARANYREQAEVLAESGVDVIALEMMRDLEQTTYALEAAVDTGYRSGSDTAARPPTRHSRALGQRSHPSRSARADTNYGSLLGVHNAHAL